MQQTDITLQNIWEAIHQIKGDMNAHIDARILPIQTSINKIQGSLSPICDQLSELEQRVSSNEDNVEDITKRVQQLEKENAYLKGKIEDAENRSRACNLRFINIPEKAEGRDSIGFVSNLIPLLFGEDNFPTSLHIERAHRSPTTNSGPSNRPRPLLVKLLSFHDKVRILRLAREKKDLFFQGTRIYIFPDFSVDLAKRHRQFDAVKKKLRERDIHYSLLYPCTLRITVDGKSTTFRCPAEVENYIQQDLSISSIGL